MTEHHAFQPDERRLEGMTVLQLRQVLREMKLPVSGRKADLRARISGATQTPAAMWPTSGRMVTNDNGEIDAQLHSRLAAIVAKNFGRGPQTGIFCDGGCTPNPGPGGWGAVAVHEGQVQWLMHGHEPKTTNNRMELTAIIQALRRIPPALEIRESSERPPDKDNLVLHTDSRLCVQTLNEWAPTWKGQGWRRATGEPVLNQDLVEEAYELRLQRSDVSIKWIRGHDGSVWNEYADCLAGAYKLIA
eukprot:CAMPEP_0119326304 /NCGR_PEP_ID=MMETSP1333-20130426/68071_1 /TAXON_ID=418940 /ORGANISM="Scyphosphaera apsteinii, Strain RCC1455" /LENGTH=245 /DNA_ID=CAMNT_0007334583 /DNA_START=177 /DNA_END=914 /DNA_ORIENTATION=+